MKKFKIKTWQMNIEQQHRVESNNETMKNKKIKTWLPLWCCWWCSSPGRFMRVVIHFVADMIVIRECSLGMVWYCLLNEKHEWWKWKDHTIRRRFFFRMKLHRNVKRTKFEFSKRWQWQLQCVRKLKGRHSFAFLLTSLTPRTMRKCVCFASFAFHVVVWACRWQVVTRQIDRRSIHRHDSRSNEIFAPCKFLLLWDHNHFGIDGRHFA